MTTSQSDNYDGPWKEMLERFFEPFMAFFFPHAYHEIDWSRPSEFLDKELLQIAQGAGLSRQLVDKLVKVWLHDGESAYVLVHVEVQSQHDADFARRMYLYNHRLYMHYGSEVVSLAILGDESATWRPHEFRRGRWGSLSHFTFPIVKLLDYAQQWTGLEASSNPFALFVMAHLKTQETRHRYEERYTWKLDIVQRLYQSDFLANLEDSKDVLLFINWLMQLPKPLEEQFWDELQKLQEEQQMPSYISTIELRAIEKGRQEGLQEGRQEGLQEGLQEGRQEGLLDGIELGLELKFGADGLALMPEIRQIADSVVLRAIRTGIKGATTPDDIRRIYAQ